MDLRALNRATLHRQLLLQRRRLGPAEAIELLGGLNAQQPNDPYLALHSRLDGFAIGDLTGALEAGTIVRSVLMRATQHLVGADCFARLRPVLSPMLQRVQRNTFGKRTAGVDLGALVTAAREILAGRVVTRPELSRALAERFPGADSNALAWSVQYLLPLTHPAPSGTWNSHGAIPVRLTPVGVPDVRWMVRWYLAAFGPATVSDLRAWSGVAGLREVVSDMRGELLDLPGGYWDLPDAPRPGPDTPAPVRLVAGFDNLLLAFADRRRVMTDEVRARVCVGDLVSPTLLVDGFVCGTWALEPDALVVTPFRRLRPADAEAAVAEGERMLALADDYGLPSRNIRRRVSVRGSSPGT